MNNIEVLRKLKVERKKLETDNKLNSDIEKEEKKIYDLKPVKGFFNIIWNEIKKYRIEFK